MALLTFNFESQYLNSNHEISIILPDKPRDVEPAAFYGSGRKYKVLWLLHGTFGDHSDWIRKSNIELYACEKDLIVVMPSGLNANYANWEHFSIGYNMYDYFLKELMPLIYGWFPASDKREDNFIAGLSMGGTGTLVYALNNPERFAAAAVLSCCPFQMGFTNNADMDARSRGMIENRGGLEKFQASYENTWGLVDKLAGSKDLPRFYFAIGKDDFLYESYKTFKAHAAQIGFDAKFEEFDGYKHEWRFWDLTIQRALEFFGLSEQGAGNPF
ncbi:MAG: alpha/beta hydrolase [Candidatus Spyradocola sp.]|jgi:putative tributyrin esterase